MENTVVATFLYIAAVAVAASGVIIIALRKYMDRVVSYVYGGEHFPFWFWPAYLGLIVIFAYVVYAHFTGPHTWAGWITAGMIGIGMPAQWAAVIFRRDGRQFLANLRGDWTFIWVGLVRIFFGGFLWWLATNA